MREINFRDLIESGQLRKEPAIGRDQVDRFMKRAEKDLRTADHVKSFDEAIAMQAAYDAMFHAANALLRRYGYRPGPVRQHQGVISAVSRILGEEGSSLIRRFDRLRRRRNEFEYQGLYEMGTEELAQALESAAAFVELIEKTIR